MFEARLGRRAAAMIVATGTGTAVLAGALAVGGLKTLNRDESYRREAWELTVPTDEGNAICYSNTKPERIVETIYLSDVTVALERRNLIDQYNFACDNARVLGYRDGERVLYLGYGYIGPETILRGPDRFDSE